MSAGKDYLVVVANDSVQQLIRDIESLEARARDLHLYPSMRALNNAKNAAGWQAAGNITMAAAASTRSSG